MNQSLSSQPFQQPNPISLNMVQGVLTIGEAFALALVDPKAGSSVPDLGSFPSVLKWKRGYGFPFVSALAIDLSFSSGLYRMTFFFALAAIDLTTLSHWGVFSHIIEERKMGRIMQVEISVITYDISGCSLSSSFSMFLTFHLQKQECNLEYVPLILFRINWIRKWCSKTLMK